MRDRIRVATALAAALAACGPEIERPDPGNDPTSSCQQPHVENDFEVAVAELEGIDLDDCQAICEELVATEVHGCALLEDTGGSEGGGDTDSEAIVRVNCEYDHYCLGRGHAALERARAATHGDVVGRWLARAARSEAASVIAFLALARELERHGAPAGLLRRCTRAAADEVRHARTMTALAALRGVKPMPPRFGALVARDLETIAIENAAEGCVNETWAALEGLHQARRARDPAIRRVMGRIAVDETRHAQLSWDLDAWARARLSVDARRRIDHTRADAIASLTRSLRIEREPALRSTVGLASTTAARALLDGLRLTLWS
jgi:hypothetical protein